MACCLVVVITRSFWCFLPAVLCWIVAAVIESKQTRQFSREMKRFRDLNRAKYSHIFSSQAPAGLVGLADDQVHLYDCESCTYLGLIPKQDIQLILQSYAETPELLPNGDNDIPFSMDDLEAIPFIHDQQFSDDFLRVLQPAMDSDYLMELLLRWVPEAQAAE